MIDSFPKEYISLKNLGVDRCRDSAFSPTLSTSCSIAPGFHWEHLLSFYCSSSPLSVSGLLGSLTEVKFHLNEEFALFCLILDHLRAKSYIQHFLILVDKKWYILLSGFAL